eukprot:6184489-Pleurochrysis_carterae.AAC.1
MMLFWFPSHALPIFPRSLHQRSPLLSPRPFRLQAQLEWPSFTFDATASASPSRDPAAVTAQRTEHFGKACVAAETEASRPDETEVAHLGEIEAADETCAREPARDGVCQYEAEGWL